MTTPAERTPVTPTVRQQLQDLLVAAVEDDGGTITELISSDPSTIWEVEWNGSKFSVGCTYLSTPGG